MTEDIKEFANKIQNVALYVIIFVSFILAAPLKTFLLRYPVWQKMFETLGLKDDNSFWSPELFCFAAIALLLLLIWFVYLAIRRGITPSQFFNLEKVNRADSETAKQLFDNGEWDLVQIAKSIAAAHWANDRYRYESSGDYERKREKAEKYLETESNVFLNRKLNDKYQLLRKDFIALFQMERELFFASVNNEPMRTKERAYIGSSYPFSTYFENYLRDGKKLEKDTEDFRKLVRELLYF